MSLISDKIKENDIIDRDLISEIVDALDEGKVEKAQISLNKLKRSNMDTKIEYYLTLLRRYGIDAKGYFNGKRLDILSRQRIVSGQKMILEANNASLVFDYIDILKDLNDNSYFDDYKLLAPEKMMQFAKVIADNGTAEENYRFIQEYQEYSESNIARMWQFDTEIAKSGTQSEKLGFVELYPEYASKTKTKISKSQNAKSIATMTQRGNMSPKDIKAAEARVLALNSAEASTQFSEIPGADVDVHRQVVIDSKNAKQNYLFIAIHSFTKDQFKSHQTAILQSANNDKYEYACRLAEEYPTKADKEAIQALILQSRKADLCARLCLVNGTNVDSLSKFAIKSKNVELLTKL